MEKMRFFLGAFFLLTILVRGTEADADVNLTMSAVGFEITGSSLFEQDHSFFDSDYPELEDSGSNDSDGDVGLERFSLEFNRARSPATFNFTKVLFILFTAVFVALSVFAAAAINFASYNLCRTGNRSGRSSEPSEAFTNADAFENESEEAAPVCV